MRSIRAHEWQRGSNVVHCCYGHGRGSEGVRDETSKFLARNTPAQPPRCAEGEAIDWVSLHCRLRPLLLNLRYPTLPSPSDQLPGLCLTAREPILAHPRPSHAQSGRPLPPSPSPQSHTEARCGSPSICMFPRRREVMSGIVCTSLLGRWE